MKSKIAWLILSVLMVLSLVLVSCGTKTTTTTEKAGTVKLSLKKLDGTSITKTVKEPKYGGTLNVGFSSTITGWDDLFANPSNCAGTMIVCDELLDGDWTRGPAGTEETTWYAGLFNTDLESGSLAKTWEIKDPNTIIFHLREGVHWQNKPPVNGREFVADDVVFSINRILSTKTSYCGARLGTGLWFKSITATDKYTVVLTGEDNVLCRTGKAFQFICDDIFMIPHEVVDQYKDMRDWKNIVGTGPFTIDNYIQDSSATFTKNPNYWGKDPLFPKNQLPYVDTVKYIIITDASTRLSALRTGQIDTLTNVLWDQAKNITSTNPELKSTRLLPIGPQILYLRADTKPFTDVRVRQALHMAVDYQSLVKDYYGGNAELLAFPAAPVSEL